MSAKDGQKLSEQEIEERLRSDLPRWHLRDGHILPQVSDAWVEGDAHGCQRDRAFGGGRMASPRFAGGL